MKPDGSDQEQVTSDEFNNWSRIRPGRRWSCSFPTTRCHRHPQQAGAAADYAAGGGPTRTARLFAARERSMSIVVPTAVSSLVSYKFYGRSRLTPQGITVSHGVTTAESARPRLARRSRDLRTGSCSGIRPTSVAALLQRARYQAANGRMLAVVQCRRVGEISSRQSTSGAHARRHCATSPVGTPALLVYASCRSLVRGSHTYAERASEAVTSVTMKNASSPKFASLPSGERPDKVEVAVNHVAWSLRSHRRVIRPVLLTSPSPWKPDLAAGPHVAHCRP